MALEGYTLEIIKKLKGKQQGTTIGEEGRRGKRAREKDGKRETGAEKSGTRDAKKFIKKREEIERKRKRKRRRRRGE